MKSPPNDVQLIQVEHDPWLNEGAPGVAEGALLGVLTFDLNGVRIDDVAVRFEGATR